MGVVGVHINKINAEKRSVGGVSRVGINNNVAVTHVEQKDFAFGQSKQGGLRFAFEFTCNYSPEVGSIHLEGEVLYITDEDKAKDIKKEWDEKKKLSYAMMEPILNPALTKCNIEAVKISPDIGLPVPIPLPKIERKARAPPAKAK